MRRLVAVLCSVLLLAACSGDTSDQVRDAVAATFAGDFTFALTASADAQAIEALGSDAASVALALDGFALFGARTSDGTQVALQVAGGVRLVELVTLTNGNVYLRTDATALGEEGLSQLLTDLRASGASGAVVNGVEALFEGSWVGIEGQAGLDGLLDEVIPADNATPGATEAADVTALADLDLAGALDALLRAAEIGEARDLPGDARRYPLTVSADRVERGLALVDDDLGTLPVIGALLSALEAGAIDGDVVVKDGIVTSLQLGLAAGDVSAGQLELLLDLADHDDVPAVQAPVAIVVEAQDLAAALVALLTPGASR